MQLLGGPPSAATTILAQVLDDQAHILYPTQAGFRMAEPEALRVTAHQGRGALDQFRWREGGRCPFLLLLGQASHADNLETGAPRGKHRLSGRRIP